MLHCKRHLLTFIFVITCHQKHGMGQGRKGGDEEAADEDYPDTPQEYEAEDTAQVF